MIYRFLAAVAALLFPLHAVAQQPVMPGEAALAAKAVPAPRLRLGTSPGVADRTTLAPVSEAEIESVRLRNRADAKGALQEQEMRAQRFTIGLARPVTGVLPGASPLEWTPVAGGHAAQTAVTSPGAGSLRLAIDLAGVPVDVEMVFFGSADPARLEGPVKVGDVADRSSPWWSPLTEGDTQTVEFYVPSRHEPATLALAVAGASHVFATPSSGFTKRVQDIGLAGSCNVDVPCSALASSQAFRDAANSTAQMVFSDAGFTVLCTGTLLADGDASTQTPWLYGANHCFENESAPYKSPAQMQAVANTLTTLWGFEASACNSRTARSGWSQLGGGATYINNSVTNDVLFLRLNGAPPSGSYYSGWDANPVPGGAALVTLHHPQGDLKKTTQGTFSRFSAPGVGGANASFIEARWSSGTTEQGSSGGGVWTTSGGQYRFRGGLWGGSASCSNLSGTDFYSRFDHTYPFLAAYLGSGAAPATDYTDLWWNPQESGWGLKLIQHPSRVIFGVWYTYELDGTQTWYVLPSGSWTSANTYAGTLYTTAGPPFTAAFDPLQVEKRAVGNATITFSDANNGVFSYSIDGVSGSKSITRQPF
jgi:lysyl endopeptidase